MEKLQQKGSGSMQARDAAGEPEMTRSAAETIGPPAASDHVTTKPGNSNQPSPMKWSRNDTNFWLDAALLIGFLWILILTAITQYVFPAAGDAASCSLFGWDFDKWRLAQSISIAAFALLVVIHLVLHWTWVMGVIAGRFSRHLGRRIRVVEPMTTLYGVAFLTFCLGLIGAAVVIAELQLVE